MNSNIRTHATACLDDARETVEELRIALSVVGIKLPSLALDLSSVARETPCPHVELGGCTAEVAARLAVVLRHAGREGGVNRA